MDPKQQIFRKVALERLSSPEQLDTLLRVVRPADWLLFAPLAGLLAVVVMWGLLGSIPTKVSGKCMLINPTGLTDISATAPGRLTTLSVKVGDPLTAGQEIGLIALPELSERIENARARLRDLEDEQQQARSFARRGSSLSASALARQRAALEAQRQANGEKLRLLEEQAQTQTQWLAQGIITQQTLLATRQAQNAAFMEGEQIAHQLSQLDLRRLEAERQSQSELGQIDQRLQEARRELDSLLQSRKNTAVIESPFSGRVVEIKAGPGMLVAQGGAVLSLERDSGQNLEAAIYVPAGDGKRVHNGMTAQVVPATVKREEHGYLLARVHHVSEYPTSAQGMQRLVQNEAVARSLTGDAPSIEIRAALRPAQNPSGFLWSSAAGAPLQVRTGTLCQAEIVIATQRPISLVVPALKKSLGVDG